MPSISSHALCIVRFMLYLLVAGISAPAQTGKPYPRIETGTHAAKVSRIDVDAAERFLVSASDDKTARVWELQSGRLLKILRPPIGDAQEGMLHAVAISPDGTSVAVGGSTGAPNSGNNPIYIFERESGAIRRTIPNLPEATNHLAFSKDGRYLVAALHGKNGIRIFETAGYSEIAGDVAYADTCYWVEFDRSGRLVTASEDGFVRLYGANFHFPRKAKPGGGRPFSARFSPDGKLIAVGFTDTMAVSVVSGADLSRQYELQTPISDINLATALWSDDGRTVCAAGRYGVDSVVPVFCWDRQGKGTRNSFPLAGNTITDIRAVHDEG